LEPNLPQHDETIVPVRPRLRAGTPSDQPAAPTGIGTRLRDSLVWVGGAALLVAIGAAFFWFPAQREHERAAAAAAPAAGTPATESAPAKPVLSPVE
jgi:hypothetical protein